MANVRSSTGDDEFRTYMNDFESYLHNIGSNARTASPEQMTSSVETGEQGDWNNDTRNTSDSCNIAQFEIDQPYTTDLMSGHDRQLDEQYDSYTYGQQTEAAANDDYFYNSQQAESDVNQQQQQQYSGYEAESDYVNSDIVNEPTSYANVNAGSDDYVPQVITVAEGLEDVVPESQTENHVTDNNDDNDDDDDDDETDDYIEHEYLIAQHTPKQQQAETLENDVTPAVDSDDRSTDDNGEGITDSLTEGEYYVSQQTTHDVQQTYYETAENGHYVTSDVHQYYEEESALLKVDDDEHLKHDATTRIEDANTPVLTDDVQQYSQYVQEQDEESQFTEQTTETTYYDDSLHSNNMPDQNSKSVSADEYIDNEQHLQQQNKQVKFSINDDRQQRVNVTHDDDDDENEKASVNDNAAVDNNQHHQQQHDDDGNEQRPSERGRIRDLLAHWRQFEQQVSRSSLTDSRSGAGSSGYHTRSRSCGPVTRRHHITTYDNSRSNDDSAAPYNVNDNRDDDDDDVDNMNNLMTSTDRVYRRAAILAKFENLDAEAHKSAITTKKREFKWSVKEPKTLGRPVGLHCS